MKYRKKPVVIEAVRFTGSNFDEVRAFMSPVEPLAWSTELCNMTIGTLEGEHIASAGDWIIRGVKGELYPCRDDVFRMTYEEVNDAT